LRRNQDSAAIAPMVMQFCHQINMDEVFGTHRGRVEAPVAGM
jgi:hypothetical protein